MVENFIWKINGRVASFNVNKYVVVRMLISTVGNLLPHTKGLPRINQAYQRMETWAGTWMPVIEFTQRRESIIHLYTDGNHTSYCAKRLARKDEKMCFMVKEDEIDLFRKFIGNEPFEVFTIEQYQNELPPHERKTYSDSDSI